MPKKLQTQIMGTKTVSQAFDEFLKWCKAKNLSEYSILFYERQFGKFLEWYGCDDLDGIDQNTIQNFILYLQEKDVSDITVNTYLRAIRAVLYYWMELGYLPKFKISLVKAQKKVKETYTDEELALLLKKPDLKKCTFAEYRNWVLVNYLLATGNRISTVVNLKIKDLDFDNDCIILRHTKNKRQQIIPMSSTLKEVLLEYLKYRKGTPDDYLFCNEYGEQMQVNSLKTAIRRYNQSRGVMKTSCHAFRHTFAKKYILAGGDIFRLQKLLGHSSLEMVKEYVNMFAEDLKQNFDNLNPLEQIVQKREVIRLPKRGRR